jgi:membrane-bound lytic murein transglycosylase B
MTRTSTPLLWIAGLLLCAACSPDRTKLEPVYRAAKTIEGTAGVGITAARLAELVQQLNTEIGIARDKRLTPTETQAIEAYADGVAICQDALVLLVENARNRYASNVGMIQKIQQAYGLPLEYTGTVDTQTSTQTLLATAEARFKAGHEVYLR